MPRRSDGLKAQLERAKQTIKECSEEIERLKARATKPRPAAEACAAGSARVIIEAPQGWGKGWLAERIRDEVCAWRNVPGIVRDADAGEEMPGDRELHGIVVITTIDADAKAREAVAEDLASAQESLAEVCALVEKLVPLVSLSETEASVLNDGWVAADTAADRWEPSWRLRAIERRY